MDFSTFLGDKWLHAAWLWNRRIGMDFSPDAVGCMQFGLGIDTSAWISLLFGSMPMHVCVHVCRTLSTVLGGLSPRK